MIKNQTHHIKAQKKYL